jgi:hypothetical protein
MSRKMTDAERLEKLASRILTKKRNISCPGAGYYLVRIPGFSSVSGHWHSLKQKIIEVLQAGRVPQTE